MSNTITPNDEGAERALIASLVAWPQLISDAIEVVLPGDIYSPRLAAILMASYALHRGGDSIDPVTVSAECKSLGRDDITAAEIMEIVSSDSTKRWRGYADIVLDRALRRRLILEARTLLSDASDLSSDAALTLDKHRANVASIDTALIGSEPDDVSVEEFVARTSAEPTPWVIRGLIRRGHRVVIVGGEGQGKSTLIRQIAECAAYGIHPFRYTFMTPKRVLIIDLENPEDALHASFKSLLHKVKEKNNIEETVNRLWWRPGGIDLRKRADRAELENIIAKRKPDLVVLGPLYKAYNVNVSEGYELPAREVQQALDKLRERYGFALLMEDHAPQAAGGAKRDIRPYGSSFWLRWPEMGIGLTPAPSDDHELILSRWRGDRSPSDWPSSVKRGKLWPWEPVYDASDREF